MYSRSTNWPTSVCWLLSVVVCGSLLLRGAAGSQGAEPPDRRPSGSPPAPAKDAKPAAVADRSVEFKGNAMGAPTEVYYAAAVADRSVEFKVFHLVNAEAVTLSETVAGIVDAKGVKISVDPRTNSIVASGDSHTLEVLEALILRLDGDRSQAKAVRVRVVWLASGLPAEAGTEPAEDLKPVLAELAAVGVSDLRQVGQAMINTLPDCPFEIVCLPRYEKGPAEMQLHGMFQDKGRRPMLDIQISAKQIVSVPHPQIAEAQDSPGKFRAGQRVAVPHAIAEAQDSPGKFRIKHEALVTLDTQIAAPYGHYVVLGVTPVERANSVFVVEVTPCD